mgnify:FL=1
MSNTSLMKAMADWCAPTPEDKIDHDAIIDMLKSADVLVDSACQVLPNVPSVSAVFVGDNTPEKTDE